MSGRLRIGKAARCSTLLPTLRSIQASPWPEIIGFVIGVLVCLLFAPYLAAQNSTAADELYLPIVVHAAGSPSWGTELLLFNPTDETVSISLTFIPANRSDDDPNVPLVRSFPDVLRLPPHSPYTLTDAHLGELIGPNAQGMLIIDGCKAGESCAVMLNPVSNPRSPRYFERTENYRAISAEAHVYAYTNNPSPAPPLITRGGSYLAVPWYLTSSGAYPVVAHPVITGIRSDRRTSANVVLANASSFSHTVLTATLFDGEGGQVGQPYKQPLGPLESVKRAAEAMWPEIAPVNRLNRQPSLGFLLTGLWVRVEQSEVVPTATAASHGGCADGCPAFEAMAVVTDSSTCVAGKACVPDIEFEMAQYETVNQSSGVAAERISLGQRRTAALANARVVAGMVTRPATSEVLPFPCRVTNTGDDFYVEYMHPDGKPVKALDIGAEKVSVMAAQCSGTKPSVVVAAQRRLERDDD